MRTRTILLLAVTVAVTAALARSLLRRRTALVDVPSDLRHPMLYLPLDAISTNLPDRLLAELSRRATTRASGPTSAY